MNMCDMCRGCMKDVASWERQNFSENVADMFCCCTNIKVTDDDNLPKQFCYDCLIKIELCYAFIKEAQKVDAILRNIISRSITSVIVKTNSNQVPGDGVHNLQKQELVYSNDNIDNNKTVDAELLTPVKELNYPSFRKNDNNICENNTRKTSKNVCPVCFKGFISKTWFLRHMIKDHTESKLSCNQCSKKFNKPSELISHLSAHSVEQFTCSVCGKGYMQHRHLEAHERSHSKTKVYCCDKCNMSFKAKNVLIRHLAIHDDKRYLCSFCGQGFCQASNLIVHTRRHTGEKPFGCAVCGFRATTSSSVRRHERAHAASPSRHTCTVCRKGFYDAGTLARHRRTHTGELPYQCPECPRAFVDSWKRKAHLMRKHSRALADIPRMRKDGQPVTG